MIKPDGVQRGLVPEILKRFQDKGYKLVALKMSQPEKLLLEEHYAEHKNAPFFPGMIKYMMEAPVVCMVWEGSDVVKQGRKLLGETKPSDSNPGTIRGDFGIEVGRNLIHGSDAVESANREIRIWFNAKEICSYTAINEPWVYEKP